MWLQDRQPRQSSASPFPRSKTPEVKEAVAAGSPCQARRTSRRVHTNDAARRRDAYLAAQVVAAARSSSAQTAARLHIGSRRASGQPCTCAAREKKKQKKRARERPRAPDLCQRVRAQAAGLSTARCATQRRSASARRAPRATREEPGAGIHASRPPPRPRGAAESEKAQHDLNCNRCTSSGTLRRRPTGSPAAERRGVSAPARGIPARAGIPRPCPAAAAPRFRIVT